MGSRSDVSATASEIERERQESRYRSQDRKRLIKEADEESSSTVFPWSILHQLFRDEYRRNF